MKQEGLAFEVDGRKVFSAVRPGGQWLQMTCAVESCIHFLDFHVSQTLKSSGACVSITWLRSKKPDSIRDLSHRGVQLWCLHCETGDRCKSLKFTEYMDLFLLP